eukprot:gnl/TRDRNA2_/TRDRNA2_80801_c0_seq2.p1 gnl/TRDRNA2_/TRDRNA2_80801_c0~~gnl/TRDRNA2_/TRDRNA2_80801_c0_seq2.p1  ORF type:complete len:235 (-),score=18.86 gnl/TRDRNA2_/TRDRNA2_80801_c0_seq2:11-715(-)
MARALLFCAGLLLCHRATGSCPNLAAIRSERVKAEFDVRNLVGRWYVQRYRDIAMLGASCPRIDAAQVVEVDSSDGCPEESLAAAFIMDLQVNYIRQTLPFTIREVYEPSRNESLPSVCAGARGLYTKKAEILKVLNPVTGLLTLPTAIVDFAYGDRDDDGRNPYTALLIYSCVDLVGSIDEVVLLSRHKALSGADLATLRDMTEQARARGLAAEFDDLQPGYDVERCDRPSLS